MQGFHAGTNISLDLDHRVMPKGPMFPRYAFFFGSVLYVSQVCLQASTEKKSTTSKREHSGWWWKSTLCSGAVARDGTLFACFLCSYLLCCIIYYTSVLSSRLPLQTRIFFLLIEKVLTDCFRFEPRFGVCLDTDLLIQVACYLDPWCFPSSIFSFYLFFTWFWQPSSAERLSLSKSHKPFKKRIKIQLYNAENDLPSRGYFTLFSPHTILHVKSDVLSTFS